MDIEFEHTELSLEIWENSRKMSLFPDDIVDMHPMN